MTAAKTPKHQGNYRLPDPPQRDLDEMTAYDHLHKMGNSHHLALYFGNPETTLVEADRWIVPHSESDKSRGRRPDLLIAFDVNYAAYEASNGYIISEQGKPPDFVIEIASESTAEIDTGAKRDDYAALGISEYWRFDQTGQYHGAKLAGDRLVDRQYQPIPIEHLPDDILQGYSQVLNLNIRWDHGQLGWLDPQTGREIPTFEQERESRLAAEAQVRELEEELRRLRNR